MILSTNRFFPIQVLPYPPQWAFKQHAPYDA